MSSEPERLFSGAEYTVLDSRGSLKSKTIELLECLKSLFRLSVFMKEDLRVNVDNMEEGATETRED